MKCFLSNPMARTILSMSGMVAVLYLSPASAEIQSGEVLVKAVHGVATYSTDHVTWRPLQPDLILKRGAVLKTGADATADLVMEDSGTALRMTPDTELEVARLNTELAGEQLVTETTLNLKSGAIIGSQRKLSKPSRFDINISGGVATIRGTEYLVRADGAVTCVSGEVEVKYTAPGSGKCNQPTIDSAQVPAGYSFNPATGSVVPTTSAYLKNIIADVNAVRDFAQVFKVGRGTFVVVEPESKLSPICGHGHGHGDDDNDRDHGRDGHDGHDGHDGRDGHEQAGNGPGYGDFGR
jgi:hypothetical protein